MNNNKLYIVAQAFYGNRTETEIEKDNLDRFILGYLDDYPIDKKIDRTIIKVPGTDNLVFVYNKYQEEDKLNLKRELLETENYELKPLVFVPGDNIKLYSRCIVCRIDNNGELASLEDKDFEKFMKYLA